MSQQVGRILQQMVEQERMGAALEELSSVCNEAAANPPCGC